MTYYLFALRVVDFRDKLAMAINSLQTLAMTELVCRSLKRRNVALALSQQLHLNEVLINFAVFARIDDEIGENSRVTLYYISAKFV